MHLTISIKSSAFVQAKINALKNEVTSSICSFPASWTLLNKARPPFKHPFIRSVSSSTYTWFLHQELNVDAGADWKRGLFFWQICICKSCTPEDTHFWITYPKEHIFGSHISSFECSDSVYPKEKEDIPKGGIKQNPIGECATYIPHWRMCISIGRDDHRFQTWCLCYVLLKKLWIMAFSLKSILPCTLYHLHRGMPQSHCCTPSYCCHYHTIISFHNRQPL